MARELRTTCEGCEFLTTLLEVAKAAKEDVSHVEALRAAAIKAGARNAGPHNPAYIRLRAALAKLEKEIPHACLHGEAR